MRKRGWLQKQLQNAASVVHSLPPWMRDEDSTQQPAKQESNPDTTPHDASGKEVPVKPNAGDKK
jgi:hypothetical protein